MSTVTPKEKEQGGHQDILMQSLEELNNFHGQPAEFLTRLLQVKCRATQCRAAALLRADGDGKIQVLALAPSELKERTSMPAWLREAIRVLPHKESDGCISTHYFEEKVQTGSGRQCLAFLPVKSATAGLGTEVYLFRQEQLTQIPEILERLQLLMPYFDFYEGRLKLKDYQQRTERLHEACEVLVKLNQSRSFLEGAMQMCNEAAARFSCSRVSIGVLSGRYVRLKALSNTEKFNKNMKILQDLEKVMEESLDQDLEVLFPQTGQADYVARAASAYSQEYGPLSIVSLPLRLDGKVLAVLTFEREKERPFASEEVETFRLICDLFSSRLLHMHNYERWFGARFIANLRKFFSLIIGAKHTWLKLGLIALVAVGAWLSQAQGLYQVEATFTFESQQQQMIVAPFDAEIGEVFVRNGHEVKAGQKLLVLETTEQHLQLNNLTAQRLEALKRVSVAMNEGKTAEAQIAQAEADQTAAEIELIEYNISRAVLKAPIDGSILTDDLHKRLFSIAQFGESLLEVVQLNKLEAVLFVPEDQIADVEIDYKGELAAAGYPDRKVPFKVREIKQVAQVAAQLNVFQVKVDLLPENRENFLKWARPGMEGAARIDVEDRLLIWNWTRKAINYVRMKFWF